MILRRRATNYGPVCSWISTRGKGCAVCRRGTCRCSVPSRASADWSRLGTHARSRRRRDRWPVGRRPSLAFKLWNLR